MVFKCGPSKLISFLNSNPSAELEITMEIKMRNIPLIANDFNGSNSFCFDFLLFSFLWLSLTKDRSFWFCNNFLVIYQGFLVKS